jgi:hypothetical protein
MREEFGFKRSECACRKCQIWCEHIPGSLIPSDLERLVPPGVDPLAWAEEHLRVQTTGVSFLMNPETNHKLMIVALVPAKSTNGHCHWYFDRKCTVHEASPFSCAFFDCHMAQGEKDHRSMMAVGARFTALKDNQSLYRRICDHLLEKGLIYDTPREDNSMAHRRIEAIERHEATKNCRKQRKAKKG